MSLYIFILPYLILYSFLGWICESFYISINQKRFVNSGFLSGPYCPIYGFGALGIILFLSVFKSNLFLFFLTCIIFTSLLEYTTSFVLELFFHSRWWDYSDHRFNLKGRVCLFNSILFGVASILLIYVIHPQVDTYITKIPSILLIIGTSLILIIFFFDFYNTIQNQSKRK